jgi:hypothetical protein
MRVCVTRGLAAIVAAMFVASCNSASEPPGAIAVGVAPSLSLSQGVADTLPITITRSHYDRAIHLSVSGMGGGVTASVSPPTVTTDTTAPVLIVTAGSTASPGALQLVVHASGDGVAAQEATVDVSVAITGSYALAMADPVMQVAQGGGDATSVMIQRQGGHADSVRLAISGVTAGLDVRLQPQATVQRDATVIISTPASTPVGTYTLTITGTAAGLPDQVTTLRVKVRSPLPKAPVTVAFCPGDVPLWFAYQNEGFPWQGLADTDGAFTFDATARVGVVFVFTGGALTETLVLHVTRGELSAISDRDCLGPSTVYGNVEGLKTGQQAEVAMGNASAFASSGSPMFSLMRLPERRLDAVAVAGTLSGENFRPNRMIVRRSLSIPSGGGLAPLDFATSEAFRPDTATLTVGGGSAFDVLSVQNTLLSATSTYAILQQISGADGVLTLYSLPAKKQVAGDLHELSLSASPLSHSSGREAFIYYDSTDARDEALGPALASPAVEVIAATPYVRVRGQLPAQGAYGDFARFGFFEAPSPTDERYVIVATSAAYLGSTPGTWTLTIPHFGDVPGFETRWMLRADEHVDYFADAYAGRTQLLFGDPPRAGESLRDAYLLSATSALRRLRVASAATPRRLQYFRR